MSSEQFENNEDDLATLLTGLTSRVETRLPRLVGEERKSTVRECEREIDEAEALVKEMREEASVAPPQYRSQMMSKVSMTFTSMTLTALNQDESDSN